MKRTINTTEFTFKNHNVERDNEIAEFYLADDFGEKLDMARESAQFVKGILNRLMAEHQIDFDELSFTGNKNSMIYFLSRMFEQYMRYKILKYYKNENEDFFFSL